MQRTILSQRASHSRTSYLSTIDKRHLPSWCGQKNSSGFSRSRCNLAASCSTERRSDALTKSAQRSPVGISNTGSNMSSTSRVAPINSSSRGPTWLKAGDSSGQNSPSSVLVPGETLAPLPPPGEDNNGDDGLGWQWFNLQMYAEKWNVPWNGWTVVGVMALWALSFVTVGFFLVPGAYKYAGIELSTLGPDGRAGFTLISQIAQTIATLALVWGVTSKSINESGTKGLFRYSLAAPFSPRQGWLAWGLSGLVLAPFAVTAVATVVTYAGYEDAVGGKGTVDGVANMINLDVPTYSSLLAVTGFMAPVLEETLFRGFLLTSLTKWLPTWAAVGVSSLAFGLAHFSPRDLPVLTTLGVLLGFSYVRSKNLLTPIFIHGMWNGSVLTFLFALTASGVDVEAMLKELR